MKTNILMDDVQLAQSAVEALLKALGPVETARFLALPVQKRTDSVRRHRDWQRHADKNLIFDNAFKAQK
ncbi:TPA: hypothetical protein DDW35_07165 [Candidatus Sumerlaeota bacterium]|jgi:hypothetical protein|nr:hypothetical protein [Candidatus Sumerlaeota bacterium]